MRVKKDLQKRKEELVHQVLAGLDLTEKEERFVSWLMDWELSSIESFSSIVLKAKGQKKA